MRNEEKMEKVIKKMARRKAIQHLKMTYFDVRSAYSWLYWILWIIIVVILGNRNVGLAVGWIIGNTGAITSIFFSVYNENKSDYY